MKKSRIFIFCAVLFALLATAEIGSACSCVVSPLVDIAFENTPNIAVFKLQSVEKLAEGEEGYGYGGVKQSSLTVEKVFKGNLRIGQKLTFTQGGGGDCIWTFNEKSIGSEYLFYLGEKPGRNSVWAAFACSRSNSVENASADLLYLEKTAKLRGKTRLSGTLTQSIAAVEGGESSYNRLSAGRVRISGNGKNIELKTDENGVYEIYDLPAGKYKITPEKISGYKFSREKNVVSSEVEIKAKSHTEKNFYYEIDNAIRGKLFDASGIPLENACLNLQPTRGKEIQSFYQADCTKKDGSFEFTEIPSGSYVVVINKDNEISASEPFGTFYYPSAARREDAAEINIGAGDFLEDLIITAPQTLETVTLSGVLLFENGNPVSDESVEFYAEKKHGDQEENEEDSRAVTDKNGRFNIKVLKGQKGELSGSMITFEGEYENCPKLDKLIRAEKISVGDIKTPVLKIETINDLSGIELKFSFSSCKKAAIE